MQDRPTKTTPDLFTPIEIGPLKLPNRIVMAPLTRSRAAAGNVPTVLNALYYAQRASAGLIVSEATQVAPEGQGYISTPGIHSADQIGRQPSAPLTRPSSNGPSCRLGLGKRWPSSGLVPPRLSTASSTLDRSCR
jgi:hypothetical protein